jgi:hypothetical protein
MFSVGRKTQARQYHRARHQIDWVLHPALLSSRLVLLVLRLVQQLVVFKRAQPQHKNGRRLLYKVQDL